MRFDAFFIVQALFFLCLTAQLSSVIVVVHGTFASAERWYQADGDFVQSLRSSYVHLPGTCPQKNAAIISFSWSGGNCSSARIMAAKNLAALIASYPASESVYVIAHSHGGNVVSLATHLLKKAQEAAASSILRNVFLWPESLDHLASLVGLPCSYYDYVLFQDAVSSVAEAIQPVLPVKSVENSFRIQSIYFLATPVDVSRYSCEMSSVERCYALFSKGDWIQPVGGFYQRLFPQSARFLNIEVVTVLSEKKIQLLGHADLRKPTVGQWLLIIPFLIESTLGLLPDDYETSSHLVLALLPNGEKPVLTTHIFEKNGKMNDTIRIRLEKNALQESGEDLDGKRREDPLPVLI